MICETCAYGQKRERMLVVECWALPGHHGYDRMSRTVSKFGSCRHWRERPGTRCGQCAAYLADERKTAPPWGQCLAWAPRVVECELAGHTRVGPNTEACVLFKLREGE